MVKSIKNVFRDFCQAAAVDFDNISYLNQAHLSDNPPFSPPSPSLFTKQIPSG